MEKLRWLNKEYSDKTIYFFMALSTLLYSALFIFSVPIEFPNGTDQYWHYFYIETLLNGSLKSYEIYPSFALDPLWNGDMPGFIHNMPIIYIFAAAAKVTGNMYVGPLLVNWIMAVSAALMMYVMLKKHCGAIWGLVGYVLILFFPVCFWQSIQLLTETSALFLLVLGMYILQKRSFGRIACAAGVLATCTNERTNVMLLAVFLLVLSCVDLVKNDREVGVAKWQRIAKVVVIAVIYFGGFKALGDIFGATLDFTVSRTLFDKLAVTSTFSNTTNMALHYSTETFESIGFWPMVGNFFVKLGEAIREQFGISGKGVVQWSLNALFAFAVAALVFYRINNGKNKGDKIFSFSAWGLALCALSWLVMAVVYQNQFRYSNVYLPVIFFALLVLCSRIEGKNTRFVNAIVALMLVCCLASGCVLSYVARRDAIVEYEEYIGYEEAVEQLIPADANVANFMQEKEFDYALYPRTISHIPNIDIFGYTPEQLEVLILGRYEPNTYVTAPAGYLEEHEVCADIVNEYYEYVGDANGFDVYILKGLTENSPAEVN
ncbi:MAG: hypothetical protein E7559_03790 [Ruminococcaceae bacterium]|nr:hypothetical protein [Oscillospiraceae bacterium]